MNSGACRTEFLMRFCPMNLRQNVLFDSCKNQKQTNTSHANAKARSRNKNARTISTWAKHMCANIQIDYSWFVCALFAIDSVCWRVHAPKGSTSMKNWYYSLLFKVNTLAHTKNIFSSFSPLSDLVNTATHRIIDVIMNSSALTYTHNAAIATHKNTGSDIEMIAVRKLCSPFCYSPFPSWLYSTCFFL